MGRRGRLRERLAEQQRRQAELQQQRLDTAETALDDGRQQLVGDRMYINVQN